MGYLVLNKAAGGTKILAGTNPYIQVTKADQKQELLGIETFNITIESKTPILFSVGDSIDVFGRRYWINDPQNVTIADTGDKFIYDIQMEGIQYRFINAVLFAMGISEYAPSTEVIYTANLLEALRLVITCVNFNEGWEMFVLDEATVPETKRMTLSFSDTNCLAALQTICGKDFFNVLFKFTEQQDGTYKLRVGTTVGENLPYSFRVGQKGGAYDIKRNKGGNSGVSFTRLFAYGSSENISNSYRGYSSRLRLPGAVPAGYTLPTGIELVNDTQRNLNYVQLVGATHKVSTIKTYADIKPHRTGVVSGIDGSNVNRFFDASMDFDINEKLPNGDTKYLLNGQAAKVHFNTGKLAGLEFDATYNHSQKSFTLVSYADERGQTFPDPKTTTFRVSEGDEYVILNINMPDLYIEKAEKELLVAAVKDLQDSFSPANKYTVKIRELYLKKYESPGVQNNFFNVGDFVNVKNTAMNLDSNIQILSFTRSWLNPLNYTLELSDVVTISYMVQMLGAIEAINNVVSINKLDNPARTKRNWRVSEEIASKIETLRTDMVLVGKPEGQYDTNIKFEYNYGGNRNRIISTSGALIHSVYNEGVQAGTWNVGASDNTLTDSDGMKFVYIKAEVNSASAFIVFSDNEIGVDSVVGYYHFPYCILSSVLAGSRTATKFKGRTQVIGDEISTGHIKGNGLNIDLNSGTVAGNIKFRASDNSLKTVEQAIDEVEVGGRNLILNSDTRLETNGYFLGLVDLSRDLLDGEQLTITAWGNLAEGQKIYVGLDTSTDLLAFAEKKSDGVYSCTFVFNKKPEYPNDVRNRLQLYNAPYADGDFTGFISKIKLEKGNKATDYSLAPEDVQLQIDETNSYIEAVESDLQNLKPAGKNHLIGSRLDSVAGWVLDGGTATLFTDVQLGKVVKYSRPAGGSEFQKKFTINKAELSNTELVYYCIAKPISGTTTFSFGGWRETFAMLNHNSQYRQLDGGWRLYYKAFTSAATIMTDATFGLNSIGGTWLFHSCGVCKGNTPPADWDASPKEIDFLKQGYQASTDIKGGVVQTAVLLLRNALEQVTAGISGLGGDNVINWGAGTYQDAINDAAKAFGAAMVTSFLNKDDGGGHLAFGKIAWNNAGQLIVDGIIKAIGGKLGLFDILDGSIIGRDSTGIERINISNKSIATTPAGLASGYVAAYDYQDGAVFKGNFYDYGQGDSNTYAQGVLVTNSFHLPTGSNILFGSGFSLYPFSNQSAVINHNLTTNAKIYLNGSFIGTAVDNVPFYVNGAGTVIVEEWFYLSASIVEGASTGYEIGIAGTGMGYYQATTAKSAMGQNGLYSYWNANKYLYFSEQFGLSVRGATDIPAGLGGASINSSGGVVSGSPWGKMTIQGNRVSKNGSNYTITHYIGDTNYSLILTPISANVPYFTSKSPNTVVVTCAGGFDFVLIRTK